jgi:hypothetical protein
MTIASSSVKMVRRMSQEQRDAQAKYHVGLALTGMTALILILIAYATLHIF